MFSSRNIHFAILGIILGGTFGYILAFYQAQSAVQRAPVSAAAASGVPQNHPKVSNEQMLALFKEALEKNPNDSELMTRYAGFLFETGKYPESIEWFQKVLAQKPEDANARADMATAFWNMGERDKALAEDQKAFNSDPKNIFLLHNLFLVQIAMKDLSAAAASLKKMEEIDPKYSSLPELKKQFEQASAKASK